MFKKKKEFIFVSRSKKNKTRTIFCGLATVLMLFFGNFLAFLFFLLLTIVNVFLVQKSLENERRYAEKIKKIEQAFGNDLTEEERQKLHRLVPKIKYDSDISEEYITRLIQKMDEEDEMYAKYEEDYDDDEYYEEEE